MSRCRALVVAGAALVALVVGASAAGASGPPSLDDLLDRARKTNRAIVIAFTGPSCRRCSEFDRRVASAPAVVRALERVIFVRYDIETSVGRPIAKRFGITSLPSYLAIDGDGRVLLRFSGAGSDHRWFLRFVLRASEYAEDESSIRAGIGAGATATDHLKAARWFRSRRRLAEAIESYERAIDSISADGDRSVPAEAAHELAKLTAAIERRKRVVSDAVAFVSEFPTSKKVAHELAVAVLSGDLGIERRAELLRLAAIQAPVEVLEKVVYVGLASGELTQASLAAHRLAGNARAPAAAQLVLADIYIAERSFEAAAMAHHASCQRPSTELLVRCSEQASRLAASSTQSPPTSERLRTEISMLFSVLDDPEAAISFTDDPAPLDPALVEFIPQMRRRFESASLACSEHRAALDEVWVRIEPAGANRAPKRVVVLEPGAPEALERCLVDRLDGRIGAVPAIYKRRYVAAVRFAPSAPRRPVPPVDPISRSRLHHAYLYLSGMAGVADTLGAGTRAIIDARRFGRYDAMLSWDVNGGVTSEGQAAYGMRALLGLAVRTPSEVARLSLLSGVGASRIGDALPGGYEVPVELVLTISHDRLRGLAWARTAWIFGADERKRTRGNALFGGDEYSLGVGVRVPASSPYGTFLATAYSRYANAQTISVMLGTSVDSF